MSSTDAGPTLDELLRNAGGHFSPGTAIGLSIQLLNEIRALHTAGLVHCDIRPANATFGGWPAGTNNTQQQRIVRLTNVGTIRSYMRTEMDALKCRCYSEKAQELCTECPPEFGLIWWQIGRMELEDQPDYDQFETLLRQFFAKYRIQEHPYDWE